MSDESTPPGTRNIEVRVTELRRLFNEMDPAPFHERDLDPNAEEFIVSWAAELPRDAPLALQVHVDRPAKKPEAPELLDASIHQFFANRSSATRRRLRLMFQRGRTSLLIGVAFLSASLIASELLSRGFQTSGFMGVLRESLLIGGWVAMWRPLEIFLYDWWPLRADIRLFDRLAAMPVSIKYGDEAPAAPSGARVA